MTRSGLLLLVLLLLPLVANASPRNAGERTLGVSAGYSHVGMLGVVAGFRFFANQELQLGAGASVNGPSMSVVYHFDFFAANDWSPFVTTGPVLRIGETGFDHIGLAWHAGIGVGWQGESLSWQCSVGTSPEWNTKGDFQDDMLLNIELTRLTYRF